MADRAVQAAFAEGGTVMTFHNADVAGDKFVYAADVCIIVRNNHTAAQSVTVNVPPTNTAVDDRTKGTLAKQNIVLSVPAGGQVVIPPLPVIFRNGSDLSKVSLTYSAVTALFVAFVKVKK